MSRIGKQPIELPSGVNVAISPGRVQVNGPLGELSQNVPARMQIDQDDGTLVVKRPTERGDDRALHGLTRSLVANMVEGVTKGFEKRLELQGVGYRAALCGTDLELNVGFSHPVVYLRDETIESLIEHVERERVAFLYIDATLGKKSAMVEEGVRRGRLKPFVREGWKGYEVLPPR